MANHIRCVIIDDEPVARDILRTYCNHLADLSIVGEFGNALDARELLNSQSVDLLFLDINMPVLSGTSLIQTLRNAPQVVFTTAYEEYAVQAFELSACDYLLKPFSLERFIQAVDKAKEKLQSQSTVATKTDALSSNTPQTTGFFFVRSDGKTHRVAFQNLLYAEARGNYTKLVTSETTLLPKISFSSFVEQLPTHSFIQVHRSFVINLAEINHIEGNRALIRQQEIPISGQYKESLYKAIGLREP